MFWVSSQNFPDLKNHIGLHCQEEGPNQVAELMSKAAPATTAEPWPHQIPDAPKLCFWGPRKSPLLNLLANYNLRHLQTQSQGKRSWCLGAPVKGLNSSLQGSLHSWLCFMCFFKKKKNFWHEKRLLLLPRNSPKQRKKLQMLGNQNGQGTLRSQKGCPGSPWEKERRLVGKWERGGWG